MDFELTEIQRNIKKVAREFAEKEFPPVAREYDRNEEFPREIWKKACHLGFIGLNFPIEYGGQGLGCLENCLVGEEFARVDPGIGSAVLAAAFGAEIILKFGNEAQKSKWLIPLTKGEALMGMAATEPDAGSDIASATTRAIKSDDSYVINGTKIFITNGPIANYIIVFCKTNPEEEKRSRQFSMIMVETDREGFTATKIKDKMGLRASPQAQLFFNDVRVPRENLIGKEGAGFSQLMQFLDIARVVVMAQSVGLAQGALEKTIEYTKQRKQFGVPIATFQEIQFKLAEVATRIEAARNLIYKAAWLIDMGKPDSALCAMAKWYAAETAVVAAYHAVEFYGGYGYIGDTDVERFYRAARFYEIADGTKQIQKLIISRALFKV